VRLIPVACPEWSGSATIGALLNQGELSMSLTGDTSVTLSWSDFQGTVPANPTRKAFTSTTFDIQTPFTFRVDGKTKKQTDFRMSTVTISLALQRKKMWSQPSSRTSTLLTHEQGHYEITSLLMRDLNDDLAALFQSAKAFPTLLDFTQGVDAVRQPILSLLASLQTVQDAQGSFVDGIYDNRTMDGTDATEQAKWNAAFKAARSSPPTRLKAALAAQSITVP